MSKPKTQNTTRLSASSETPKDAVSPDLRQGVRQALGADVCDDLNHAVSGDPQQSETWTTFQVFGRNAITFPDSGMEADCLIITEHINGEDKEIAAVYGPTTTEGPEMGPDVERYANLLASAPELLDVLERLMAVCRPRAYETPTPDWKWRLDLAEAAITKAKGGAK